MAKIATGWREQIIEMAGSTAKETRQVEFKESFDLANGGEWCEVVKDIVALANSGGGVILFGIRDNGRGSSWDFGEFRKLDPAQVSDKVGKYCGSEEVEVELSEVRRGGSSYPAMIIHGVGAPLVFMKPGTYDRGEGKQGTAFARGTVYFRHGAKSEPATSNDLRAVIRREIKLERAEWLNKVRRVSTAPRGHRIVLLPETRIGQNTTSLIRVTSDPNAPSVRVANPDEIYPYRLKEVAEQVSKILADGSVRATTYDIQCVRKVFGVDENPEFFHRRKFGSPQYSEAFARWIAAQVKREPGFLQAARQRVKKSQEEG